jgi:hypothetical protein
VKSASFYLGCFPISATFCGQNWRAAAVCIIILKENSLLSDLIKIESWLSLSPSRRWQSSILQHRNPWLLAVSSWDEFGLLRKNNENEGISKYIQL